MQISQSTIDAVRELSQRDDREYEADGILRRPPKERLRLFRRMVNAYRESPLMPLDEALEDALRHLETLKDYDEE